MRRLFIFFFLLIPFFNYSYIMEERLQTATEGEFIVTEQSKMYFLFLIKEKTLSTLLLEEICVPKEKVNINTVNWAKWLNNNAPHHTSWNLYFFDVNEKKLKKCYSFLQNTWISINEAHNIFSVLLSLPLNELPDEKKRKIGPPPMEGEQDRRAVWYPQMIVDKTKKNSNTNFSVYQGVWPKDNTQLSQKTIDMYFDKNSSFFFPFWIQIYTGHVHVIFRVIDSGKNLISPKNIK